MIEAASSSEKSSKGKINLKELSVSSVNVWRVVDIDNSGSPSLAE